MSIFDPTTTNLANQINVSRFIMLIQLSPGTAGSPRSVLEQGQRISSHLKRIVPQARLIQRHVVKNHCDLVDVIDAPGFEVIEQAANTIESMGHRVTDLMTATAWDDYESAVCSGANAGDASGVDPVQETSEGSFPASDAPGWTGSIATKGPPAPGKHRPSR